MGIDYLSQRCERAILVARLLTLARAPRLQFLAKLATNTAKPRGVRVLFRRDVFPLLASTGATKIPGCGPGTMAAKQFAAWGASTMLDLRGVDSGELRERLGEQLGAKVFCRARGQPSDPSEIFVFCEKNLNRVGALEPALWFRQVPSQKGCFARLCREYVVGGNTFHNTRSVRWLCGGYVQKETAHDARVPWLDMHGGFISWRGVCV